MRIESLTPAKQNCFQVTPENGRPFLITEQERLAFDLYPGAVLDASEAEALCASAGRSLAIRRAAALLSVRDMSRRELTDRLTEKSISPKNAEAAADRMAELGYLNDAAYAATWVRRGVARGWGPRRIEAEFYRRGIDRTLWSDALDTVEDWSVAAADFLSRRSGDLTDPAVRKKLSDMLARRGFDWDCIREAMRRLTEN